MGLQSYKPYSRVVSIISGLIIIIAGLDASQVINIFPEFASQINTILFVAGLLAPAISQELRVVRAEDLVKEDLEDSNSKEDIHITLNIDGEDIIGKLEQKEIEEDVGDAEDIGESDGA